ncbi:Gfo/Idh/MocA family oxidoreductase [Pedobacter heparinus]|uniref:Gfo/Idh/MocA family protein n=1 Tax=Pedobacter heparinus TaxID=984 RepID=UPI0029305073|nr:Gfo/Idh/MocA family oxidoreductase [Pedobacter heparinus]
MEDKVIGFGIVGTGAIAGIHAQAIGAITNAKLLGAYSLTKAKVTEFAGLYNCAAYNSLDEMLQTEGLDIVCICTPSGAHLEPALKSIAAGKHCLIEKPIEVTLEKTDQIIAAAKQKNVQVAVVFPTRFYPASQHLKQAIDSGRFEKLALASSYVKWSRTHEYYQSNPWRGTWKLDGGGALMNQAIHSVDMLQWCMGPVESVMAISGNVKHKDIEVEDTLVAVLKFANGAMGTIECSTAVYPGAYKKLEIMGTAGTVVMEDNDIIQWQFEQTGVDDHQRSEGPSAHSSKGGVADPKAISYSGHQKQMENLIDAIYNNGKLLIDAQEGRKSVEIVLAIYKSAQTGQLVKLPL